jgi:hypothetical protein
VSDVKIILAPNKTLRGSLAGGNTLKGGISVGGGSKIELDTTLTQSGKAADAKAVGDRLTVLEGATPSGSGGMSITAANLLLTILRNGVYTSDQSANIDALEAALKSGGDEPVVPDVPDEPVEPDLPEADVSQTGSILSIVSGVTATQNGDVLAIA